jgi:hypothetical protein
MHTVGLNNIYFDIIHITNMHADSYPSHLVRLCVRVPHYDVSILTCELIRLHYNVTVANEHPPKLHVCVCSKRWQWLA